MHVSCLEQKHFLWKLYLPLTTQHHKNNLKTTTSVMVETGKNPKYHLSTDTQRTADLQVNHIWFVQQLVPRLCFSFFGISMSKPFSHSDPMFWFCCHWDNNPYLHFGIVRSIQFVQSALASQMKGHLEVKSVLLPLLLTCLKGKPQPDKTLLNKHHPVLERQQSPIQLQKPPTSTNFANWTNY